MKGFVYIERRVLVSKKNPGGRIRYYVFAVVNGNKKSEGAFDYLADARKRKRILDGKIADYTYGLRENKDLLFCDYYEDWWQGKSLRLRPSAQQAYSGSFERYILPFFGRMRMAAITPQDVQSFVVKLKGLSPSYVRTIYSHLRAMMNTAVNHDILQKSPCRCIDLPRSDASYLNYLEPSEIRLLVERMEWPYKALFGILAMTGIRVGEALALRARNVDVERGRLRIERAWDTNTREFHEPKSRAGIRRLGIMPPLTEIITQFFEQIPNTGREALLFPSPSVKGQPISYNTIYCVFKRGLDKTGLRNVTIHSLRHSFASMMLEAGASANTLSRYLGHSSPEVTFRVYSHEISETLGDALLEASKAMQVVTGENVVDISEWQKRH